MSDARTLKWIAHVVPLSSFSQLTLLPSYRQAVPGKVITGDLNGQLCVWSTAGLHDDTVFGNTMDEEEEQSDDDCEKVRHAAQVLDRYLRNERGQLLIY